MLTIVLGTAVLILILFVVLFGSCLVAEVDDHEDLKKRHEVLRAQSNVWVCRAIIAERKVECGRPPAGWSCSRGTHDYGPCEACETAASVEVRETSSGTVTA